MFNAGIGIENFRELIELNRVYVDKTKNIELIVASNYPKITLFTRPRRFGKTLTLSMLEEFFDITKDSTKLFQGLDITNNKELCHEWMNKYPVINISLKQMSMISYNQSLNNFSRSISDICLKHNYLLTSKKVKNIDKKFLNKLYYQDATINDLGQSLYILCRALNSYWGKSCILFLDEYDVPLNYS